MPELRELTFTAAIREAFDIALSEDDNVFVMGEGVADPKPPFFPGGPVRVARAACNWPVLAVFGPSRRVASAWAPAPIVLCLPTQNV